MTGDEAKTLLREAMVRINGLMAQEKWKEAHRACLEILRFDPENVKIIRLKNKIEKIVKKINVKSIREDIIKLDPLWREKKYGELLEYLKKLEPYVIDYPKIRTLIIKAQKAYKWQLLDEQEKEFLQEMEKIKKLAAESKYQEAVRLAEKLRILRLHEDQLISFLNNVRKEWIDHELQQNRGLTDSEKYEDILLFYQGLLRIDSRSAKVKNLMEKTKKTYQMYKIEQKREFIYKELDKIKTLFQLKRYVPVIEVAESLLEIDPFNKEARFYYDKAKYKSERISSREIYKQMKSARKQIKQEMKKNRKSIVRL